MKFSELEIDTIFKYQCVYYQKISETEARRLWLEFILTVPFSENTEVEVI